jgi:hypothetical protein
MGGEIPTYRDNLKRKIAEVRGASRGGVIEKMQSATKEVVEEIQKEKTPATPADEEPDDGIQEKGEKAGDRDGHEEVAPEVEGADGHEHAGQEEDRADTPREGPSRPPPTVERRRSPGSAFEFSRICGRHGCLLQRRRCESHAALALGGRRFRDGRATASIAGNHVALSLWRHPGASPRRLVAARIAVVPTSSTLPARAAGTEIAFSRTAATRL